MSPGAFELSGDGWTLRLAGPDDSADLCALFKSVHLKSDLDLAQERDPDFFVLPRLHQGDFVTAIARSDDDGRAIGCGTVAMRPGVLAGEVVPTGYLCDLRIAPGFRGGLHLARAYGHLMGFVRANFGTELLTTVIFDANHQARKALIQRSDKRADQPVYRPMTPFQMTSVQLTRRRAAPSGRVRGARSEDRAELVSFLARRSRERVLGEVLDEARFDARLALWPGLSLEDFFLAHDARGRLVGCLAPWDTAGFKRTRVLGYHGAMAWRARLFGVAARLGGFPPLPPPGECFRFVFLTHLEVEGDDPAVLRELLLAAYARLRPQRYHFMSAFVPRGSPLARAFRGFTVTQTAMTLYVVHPPDSRFAGTDFTTERPGFEMALS